MVHEIRCSITFYYFWIIRGALQTKQNEYASLNEWMRRLDEREEISSHIFIINDIYDHTLLINKQDDILKGYNNNICVVHRTMILFK